MDRYLDEYIKTLSGMKIQKITDILKENLLEQRALAAFVEASKKKSPNLFNMPSPKIAGNVISSGEISSDFTKAMTVCSDYEAMCNRIATILESTKDIHNTTLHDLSRQLTALERLIDEFAFLYAGDPGYTYSWSDSFNNENLRDSVETLRPNAFIDRDLSKVADDAIINPSDGTLTMGEKANGFVVPSLCSVVAENALASRDGGVSPVNKKGVLLVDYFSLLRIDNPVSPSENPGAQLRIKYTTETPTVFNCITLKNRSAHSIYVEAVYAYSSLTDEKEKRYEYIPEDPIEIFSEKSIYIPATTAQRVEILYCQPHYRITINKSSPRNAVEDGETNTDVYKGVPLFFDTKMYNNEGKELFYVWEDDYTLRLTTDNETNQTLYGDAVFSGFHEYGPNTAIVRRSLAGSDKLYYHYEMFVDNIILSMDTSFSGKAIYVSKPIYMEDGVRLEEISLQATEEHPHNLQEGRETSRSTSVEYYITTNNGVTWTNIRPSNLAYVIGERLFPDQMTITARTMFPFDPTSVTVYRNGRDISHTDRKLVSVWTDKEGNGEKVSIDAAVFGSSHIYTIDYTPAGSASVDLSTGGPYGSSYAEYGGSAIRVAVLLRNNGKNPSSPQVYDVQIKGKVSENSV